MNSDFIVAVHGLVYLQHKGEIASSEELAKNICTNPARVRKVMVRLKALGFVVTKEGQVGGYVAAPSLGQVTLADIAEAVEAHFVEAKWHSGAPDKECLVCRGMAGLMDGIFEELNVGCLDRMRKLTVRDLEIKLCGQQGRRHHV